jgi:hypothetical protein
MARRGEESAAAVLARSTPQLWVVAVLFFGVGDIVTTVTGFQSGHVVEVGPLVAPLVERHGAATMVLLKLVVFGVCGALWRLSPPPTRAGVPLGLATLGVLVTGWNVGVLLVVRVPL